MELSAGIHKIDGVRGANSYLIVGSGPATVVDTGLPGNEKKILDYAGKVGVKPEQLGYILLTHPDPDHSGSVAKLKALTGAKVEIHETDAPRLSGEKKVKEVKGAMGLVFGVMGVFMRFTPIAPDIKLKDSDVVSGLTVIHTPGHTEGSISLYKEREALFSGDALLTDSAGKPKLPLGPMTLDMAQAKESIKKISTLDYGMLLPGHGPPIASGASVAVSEFVRNGFR